MTVNQIYILFMTILAIVMTIIIWRISYIYRKQKADLSRVILKLGEDKIDSDIAAMDLKKLIDHANSRNQQGDSQVNGNAKPSGSTGDPTDTK